MCGALAPLVGLNNDTSGVLVEAQRILNGQNPMTDYYSPFSFITGIIAAYGLKYLSLPILCGLSNLIYCLIIYQILKKNNVPDLDAKFSILIGSVWFLPQIGSFYYDNLAATFGLIGLLCGCSRMKNYIVLAGFFYTLAFYTKQNTGFVYLAAAIGMYAVQLNWDGIKKILILTSTFLILSTIIFIALYSLNQVEYFYDYYRAILNYGDATQKFSIVNLLKKIYTPFNIDITNVENFKSKGVLLFYPVLLSYLVINIIAFIILFKKNKLSRDFFIINLSISNILIQSLIGRGFTNLNYNLPLVSIIFFKFNKLIRSIIYTILLLIGGVYFSYESLINQRDTYEINKSINLDQIIQQSYRNNESKQIGIIGYRDSNRYAIERSLIPSNYLIFLNNLSLGSGESQNSSWQIKEIRNIEKFKPEIILLDKDEKSNGSTHLIEEVVKVEYKLVAKERGFEIWQRK